MRSVRDAEPGPFRFSQGAAIIPPCDSLRGQSDSADPLDGGIVGDIVVSDVPVSVKFEPQGKVVSLPQGSTMREAAAEL